MSSSYESRLGTGNNKLFRLSISCDGGVCERAGHRMLRRKSRGQLFESPTPSMRRDESMTPPYGSACPWVRIWPFIVVDLLMSKTEARGKMHVCQGRSAFQI
ncbi:hypothetical protein BGY98DRAFT_996408 [Russula aff. rugulosa BPL654]|nr:hypothetical protein BGY98DRAFT_996408 [Russula aff. rugulosa BPL654]